MDPFSEVLVTLGATNALFCAIMSNVGYGDEARYKTINTVPEFVTY